MKNVVLISIDSLRADALNCYDTNSAPLKTIDKLAENGFVFKNTITQATFTVASHASILTGLYPFNHGLRGQYAKRKLASTAPILLKEIGKTHKLLCFENTHFFGSDYGYDFWDHKKRSKLFPIKQTLKQIRDEPFFAFIHYWRVHTPYITNLAEGPWGYLGNFLETMFKNDYFYLRKDLWTYFYGDGRKLNRFRQAFKEKDEKVIEKIRTGYRVAIEHADSYIGNIIGILKNLGKLDDTVFILTADHGESFNEYDEIQRVPDGYEHGYLLYEDIVKVPLIIRDFSNDFTQGKSSDKQVQLIDVMPTIFNLLGKSVDCLSSIADGESLLQYMTQQDQQDVRKPSYAYTETMTDSPHNSNSFSKKASIRSEDGYKMIFDLKEEDGELVNYLENEERDIKKERPEVYECLKNKLAELMENTKIQGDDNRKEITREEQDKMSKRLKDLGY